MWHRLYYHLVWTTLDRAPLLDAQCATFLSRFLRHAAGEHRSRVLEIGAVTTHVHVLMVCHPMTEFPALIGLLKGGSSTVWNKDYAPESGWKLRWAKGYGLSSISPRQVDGVRKYLRAQPRHHPSERIEGWKGDRPGYESMRGE
jgi:putative transposase